MKELTQKLNNAGYNRDIEVSKDTWSQGKEDLEISESILGLPTVLRIDQSIYRDEERTSSVELKDYRKRDDFDAKFVAELEHFNPERHLMLHILIDVPYWALKNRILAHGPKRLD